MLKCVVKKGIVLTRHLCIYFSNPLYDSLVYYAPLKGSIADVANVYLFVIYSQVNFSSLDVHLHTEALLNSMNFLNSLLPPTKKEEPVEHPAPQPDDEGEADSEEEKKDGSTITKKSCNDHLISSVVISDHPPASLATLLPYITRLTCACSYIVYNLL